MPIDFRRTDKIAKERWKIYSYRGKMWTLNDLAWELGIKKHRLIPLLKSGKTPDQIAKEFPLEEN